MATKQRDARAQKPQIGFVRIARTIETTAITNVRLGR